jgi:hypothetical protein
MICRDDFSQQSLKAPATMACPRGNVPDHDQTDSGSQLTNGPWFRAPTKRERYIAAGLFLGFGVFFVMLFVVQRGWWFSWVILGIGIVSIVCGTNHAIAAVRMARQQYLEVPGAGAGRRWVGFVAYLLFFAAVAGVLVLLFVRFTASLRLAVGLVLFLISYMLLMGWWASRNIEGRDGR